MDVDYFQEPNDGVLKFSREALQTVRKEFNLDKREDREKAIDIIDQWVKSQDHFMKKDFAKDYIERCIATSKGSIERAKKQIDKLCTMRTYMPEYFQLNLDDDETKEFFRKGYICVLPELTKELYRVIIFKIKPKANLIPSEIYVSYKFYVLLAEYFKSYDCSRGYVTIFDFMDSNISEVISNINLVKMQQFHPILTEAFGLKIKGEIFVTSSKVIETFVNLAKPLFKEKIRERIHVFTSRKELVGYINCELPIEYGGTGKSIVELQDNFMKAISGKPFQELRKEMNRGCTDESKRQVDQFNEQYMGMSGTFRTLSLD